MTKKIALLLSGNIRTFFYNDSYIAKKYTELVNSQDIDVFIYTDNNDFNYNNIQYLSEKNTEKILGNPDIPETNKRKYSNNIEFMNYDDSCKILNKILFECFDQKLKNLYIEDFDKDLINNIYDKNNINHVTFMNNIYSNFQRKNALMCQFYKLYKCYNLMTNYENQNNFKYDIIIKSRFDGALNINNNDIRLLDLNNNLYCEGNEVHLYDWWAIGNRFIMDKYCNYYLNISPNIIGGTYIFVDIYYNWKIICSKNYEEFINENKNIIKEDVSDSSEFGLTYIIKNKNNYNLCYTNINIDVYKFYK